MAPGRGREADGRGVAAEVTWPTLDTLDVLAVLAIFAALSVALEVAVERWPRWAQLSVVVVVLLLGVVAATSLVARQVGAPASPSPREPGHSGWPRAASPPDASARAPRGSSG